MKALFKLLLVLLALSCAVPAHALTGLQRVAVMSGVPFDQDAQAYFAKLQSIGCPGVTPAFKRTVVTFIIEKKAAGSFGQDAGFFTMINQCIASVNVFQPSLYQLTFSGPCTFATLKGMNGDSSSCNGDPGVGASSLTRMSQNNAHILECQGSANVSSEVGGVTTAGTFGINAQTNKQTRISSSTVITDTAGGVAGCNAADRTSSSVASTYGNGVVQSNGVANTSAALSSTHIGICTLSGAFCGLNVRLYYVEYGPAVSDEAANYRAIRKAVVGLGGSI